MEAKGFGAGNFKVLLESVEREQPLRRKLKTTEKGAAIEGNTIIIHFFYTM